MQIARSGRGRRGYAALGVAGAGKAELARGRGVEKPRRQHAVLDHGEALRCNALGVEGARAQAASTQGIVEHVDARPDSRSPSRYLRKLVLRATAAPLMAPA